MAQSLEQGLMDVPILRTMLGLEQFDNAQATERAKTQLGIAEAANKLAELQGMPAVTRLREAQAGKAEEEVTGMQRSRQLHQTDYPAAIQRGDQNAIRSLQAEMAPGPHVTGENRSPLTDLNELGKSQFYRDRYRAMAAQATDPDMKAELLRRAQEHDDAIRLKVNSNRDLKIKSYMDDGFDRPTAIALADGQVVISTGPDGSVTLVNRADASRGVQGRGGRAMPSVEGGAPAQQQSPYKPPPDAPGVTTVVPGRGPQQRLNEEVQQLTRRLDDLKIPSLDANVNEMQRILNESVEGQLEGLGYGLTENPVAGAAYGAASALGVPGAQRAQYNRSTLQALRNDIVQQAAGLAQTVPEMRNATRELQSTPIASEADLRKAFSRWKRSYEAAKMNVMSVDPYVIQQYYKNQGAKPIYRVQDEESARSLAAELDARGITGYDIRDVTTGDAGAGRKPPPAQPRAPRRGAPPAKKSADDFYPKER